MMRVLRCVPLLLAFGSPVSAMAPAATTKTEAAARPTREEALAFVKAFSPSDIRKQAELGTLRRDFVKGLKRDETMSEMLSLFPGLGEALTEAMASQVDVYITEFDERFFPRASDLVMASMTRDDVTKLTAFYISPIGRKALQTSAAKIDSSETIDQALAGKELDDTVARRQIIKAGMASYLSMTDAEQEVLVALAMSPAGRRFQAFVPKLLSLQVDLTNDPGPRFVAGSRKAMAAAFKRVTGKEPAGN